MTTGVASGGVNLRVRETGCGQQSLFSRAVLQGCRQKFPWSRGACNNLQIKRYSYRNGGTQRPLQTIITSSIRDDSTKYFDFAVIGSGVAGLRYALEVAKHGTVAVITKAEPHESNTNYAQGGVSAVLCPSDSVENHVQDTIVAGAYLCDEETVRVVCTEGPERIRELIAMGASFDHGEDGNLHLAREGGHSHHRIVHAADMTGREIERALLKAIESDPNISVFKHHFAIDLLTSQDGSETVCHGVDTMNTKTHKVLRFISKVTLLASGGAGHIYPSTTNPPRSGLLPGVGMVHAPIALLPNSFPEVQWNQACDLAPIFNELVDRVSLDGKFLQETLSRTKKADAFTSRLLDIHSRMLQSGKKEDIRMGLHRSDYMLDEKTNLLLQIELNTISCSFSGLSCLVSDLHRSLLSHYKNPLGLDSQKVPINTSASKFAEVLAKAWTEYSNPSAVVLVVVQPGERNMYDQHWLTATLKEKHNVTSIRKTLAEIDAQGKILADGTLQVCMYYYFVDENF